MMHGVFLSVNPGGHFAQFIPITIIGGYRVYKGYKTYKR